MEQDNAPATQDEPEPLSKKQFQVDLQLFSNQTLIEEIERRMPDMIVAPRNASCLMSLRGLQARGVFYPEEIGDIVEEYIDTNRYPEVPGCSKGDDYVSVDERSFHVVAAAYKGCIEGLVEQRDWAGNASYEKEKKFVEIWSKTCSCPNLSEAEDLFPEDDPTSDENDYELND